MVLRSRILVLVSSLLILASASVAATSGKKVKLKGHLVDVACSQEQKDDLDYMRKEHSKSCFQMPACVKSGYAILTADDKVIRFDPAGNALAMSLIERTNKDKDWRIAVQGRQDGDTIAVSKLTLEKD